MREVWISLGVLGLFLSVFIIAQFSSEPPTAEITDPAVAQTQTIDAPNTPPSITEPTETEPTETEPTGEDNPNLITTDSGLKYEDLAVGTGATPALGQTVQVHYLGTLENGKKFDSSYDRNSPFSFQLGAGQVIQGWDEGLSTMQVGGKRRLFIPPALGYGSRRVGPIPANSTLIFEVELLGISS
jgi:peptidylprolyl isomerase